MEIVSAFKFEGKIYLPGEKVPKLPKDIRKMLIEKECVQKGGQVAAPVAPTSRRKTQVTKWNLDPVLLVDMSLEQLQVMIVERDGECDLPESLADCIDKLSKDFLGQVD